MRSIVLSLPVVTVIRTKVGGGGREQEQEGCYASLPQLEGVARARWPLFWCRHATSTYNKGGGYATKSKKKDKHRSYTFVKGKKKHKNSAWLPSSATAWPAT